MSVPPRLALLSAFALFLLVASPARSDDPPKTARHALEGAWTMASMKQAEGEIRTIPTNYRMIKFVADGRFVWTFSEGGKLLASAGGRYTVDGDHYSEKIEYVHGENYEWMVGKTFMFTWTVDGPTWHHVGEIKHEDKSTSIDENWTRGK